MIKKDNCSAKVIDLELLHRDFSIECSGIWIIEKWKQLLWIYVNSAALIINYDVTSCLKADFVLIIRHFL